jgi:NADH-quinone oxidoreductase subunit N
LANVDPNLTNALTGYGYQVLPEAILGTTACVLFLAAAWRISRTTAAVTALIGLGSALLALIFGSLSVLTLGSMAVLAVGVCCFGAAVRDGKLVWIFTGLFGLAVTLLAFNTTGQMPTIDSQDLEILSLQKNQKTLANLHSIEGNPTKKKELHEELNAIPKKIETAEAKLRALTYSSPVYPTQFAFFIKLIALVGGFVLVLMSWEDVPERSAGEFHGCLLLVIAGTCLTGAANDLVTLFLALELISIPTYVMLYLPRSDDASQEAAMKYFLLSVFSSGLLLFGFSYLYGLSGTTNIPAIIESLGQARRVPGMQGMPLIAVVLIVAGLGFKITAVPFHFYAPDVYQGTSIPGAALLAYVPKVAGFVALVRLLGFVPLPESLRLNREPMTIISEQLPVLLWIMAAVTMTLGNVLAFLQTNVKRMLAYSSVAHAGYMLIGLAVAPRLAASGSPVSVTGVEAVLFYLMAYGAMTIGAFAILGYLSTQEKPVETIDDLSGLSRTHPGIALLMALFLFSLIGMPFTAGFAGKVCLFMGAVSSPSPQDEQSRLFMILAVIGAINAAIGGYYYLKIVGAMYLGELLRPIKKAMVPSTLTAIWLCAAFTLAAGIYPKPFLKEVRRAMARPPDSGPGAAVPPTTERTLGVDPGRTVGQ